MPHDPVLNNGGTPPASSYANDQQPLGDQHNAARGAQKNKAVHANSAQGPDAKGATTLFQSSGTVTKLPDAETMRNRTDRLNSVSLATDGDALASSELQLETGTPHAGPVSSLDDMVPVSSATLLARRDTLGSLDPDDPDFVENLVEEDDGPVVTGPNVLLDETDDVNTTNIVDVDTGGVLDNSNNGSNGSGAKIDAVPNPDNGGNDTKGPHATGGGSDAKVPDKGNDGAKASGGKAPEAAPNFLSENPKTKMVWSAVTKRLTMPDLSHDNSKKAAALKSDVDEYHNALEDLKKDIGNIDPDLKPVRNKKSDSDVDDEGKELYQLKRHLRELKDMNTKLSAVKKRDFPGGDDVYQAWQDDLKSHSEAFDSLSDIVEMILKGDFIAAMSIDHDDDDKDKKKGKTQQPPPPSVPKS